jgi:predicted DNA-binding protein
VASIRIPPELEPQLRARAEAEGITLEAYVERALHADLESDQDIEKLAVEGFRSGEPIEAGPEYWAKRHRRLDEGLQGLSPSR